MASGPVFRESESFESLESGGLHIDCSPPTGASPSPCLVADSAAPVFPFNGDDFTLERLCASNASTLLSSVELAERHVFLCYKEPKSWPRLVEAADFDRLPRLLDAAIKSRKNEMMQKTRLTICEGRDGTDSCNGDIMIFPNMVRYRGLTHFDVDTFVEEVLVHNREWLSGRPERLMGTHIFVCSHASHDARCGISGPIVVQRFQDEIAEQGLGGHVFVKPCSHVGGHKYAGNLIIFGSNAAGKVSGHCYGYVTPDDVPKLLDELSDKGYMAALIQRTVSGRLDSEPECAAQNLVLHTSGAHPYLRNQNREAQEHTNGDPARKINSSVGIVEKMNERSFERDGSDTTGCNRRYQSNSRWWRASMWFETWELEDTLAALAVVGATASVIVAYHLYRIHSRH